MITPTMNIFFDKLQQPAYLKMNYRLILPPENLKPFVRYFWVLENSGVANSTVTFSPLADGCPVIRHRMLPKSLVNLGLYVVMPTVLSNRGEGVVAWGGRRL